MNRCGCRRAYRQWGVAIALLVGSESVALARTPTSLLGAAADPTAETAAREWMFRAEPVAILDATAMDGSRLAWVLFELPVGVEVDPTYADDAAVVGAALEEWSASQIRMCHISRHPRDGIRASAHACPLLMADTRASSPSSTPASSSTVD